MYVDFGHMPVSWADHQLAMNTHVCFHPFDRFFSFQLIGHPGHQRSFPLIISAGISDSNSDPENSRVLTEHERCE